MHAPPDGCATEPPPATSPRTVFGFVAMSIGMFMAILDIQVVATSLPTMMPS